MWFNHFHFKGILCKAALDLCWNVQKSSGISCSKENYSDVSSKKIKINYSLNICISPKSFKSMALNTKKIKTNYSVPVWGVPISQHVRASYPSSVPGTIPTIYTNNLELKPQRQTEIVVDHTLHTFYKCEKYSPALIAAKMTLLLLKCL